MGFYTRLHFLSEVPEPEVLYLRPLDPLYFEIGLYPCINSFLKYPLKYLLVHQYSQSRPDTSLLLLLPLINRIIYPYQLHYIEVIPPVISEFSLIQH